MPRPFPYFDPLGATAVLAMTAGAAGTAMGIIQWLFLRHRIHRTGWYVLASTLAWSVGVIAGCFAGAGLNNVGRVPGGDGWLILGFLFMGMWRADGLPVVGVVVGAITGLALVIPLGKPSPAVNDTNEAVTATSAGSDR